MSGTIKLQILSYVILLSVIIYFAFREKSISPISDEINHLNDSINILNAKVELLQNKIDSTSYEIFSLVNEIDSSNTEIIKVKDKYNSERERVKSLPTDSAIDYLKERLDEE